MKKTYLVISENNLSKIKGGMFVADEEGARNTAKQLAQESPNRKHYIFEANEYALCELTPCTFYTAEEQDLTRVQERDTIEAEPEHDFDEHVPVEEPRRTRDPRHDIYDYYGDTRPGLQPITGFTTTTAGTEVQFMNQVGLVAVDVGTATPRRRN